MRLPNGHELRCGAIQYLVQGNELNEARVLSQCAVEVGDVRFERGSVREVDITLRCHREVIELLRPVGQWEEVPELAKRLKNAIRAALPSGYGVANLDARVAIPGRNGGVDVGDWELMMAATSKGAGPQAPGEKSKGANERQPGPAVADATPSKESPPEYFFTLEDAAGYAGVSKRTIQEWKKRAWLKVEQDGRKIRIARTDLDKCKLRQ